MSKTAPAGTLTPEIRRIASCLVRPLVQSPMISFIGAGTAAMMVVMRFILPTIIVNGAKAKCTNA